MKSPPRRKSDQVREPIQVYLDSGDRALLDRLSARAELSRADIVRLGIRRLSADMLRDKRPGGGIDALMGALDSAPDVPADLARRHDDYLYAERVDPAKRSEGSKRRRVRR